MTPFPLVLLFLGLLLLAAKFGMLAERFKQPPVLGELLMGVLLGAIAFLPGMGWIRALAAHPFIVGLAEFGVILLLFSAGLESNLGEMKKVGLRAFAVACVGVVLPFAGGYLLCGLLLPEQSFNARLFIGATLTATSVGITARVFKDLSLMDTLEARIVLGAAVIDDVIGLLVLAVVAGMVSGGTVSLAHIGWLTFKAALFLGGSIALGRWLAPKLDVLFSRIHTGTGMKTALALSFCLIYSYGAYALAGLAPIVGAFAAGLLLDPVHFKSFSPPTIAGKLREWAGKISSRPDIARELNAAADGEERAHVEQLVQGFSSVLVPVFFVYTGLQVNLTVFGDLTTVGIALAIAAVAFAGKIACGYAAGKGADRLLIGVGMVPRGEVGLIFASMGRQMGVIDDRLFAVSVIVIVLSTLLTPPLLGAMVRRRKKQ